MTDLDALWRKHAASVPGLLDRRPDFRFDPDYYGTRVPAFADDVVALANHYRDHGQSSGLAPNVYQQMLSLRPEIDAVLADLVIDPELSAAILERQDGACELACELIHLGAPLDASLSDFSMDRYNEAHPDVAKGGMDPLLHYLLYGSTEGRRTLAELRKGHKRGHCRYVPGRPTCMIVVHEMSRTGAPIVGVDIAKEAKRTHNVLVVGLADGPLLDRFREHSCEVVVTKQPMLDFQYLNGQIFERIDFAIINSVETWPIIPFLVSREIPFASYIHEYADYILPSYKATFIALFSDLVVFSSEHVRNSWSGRLDDVEFDVARDTCILPQRGLVVGSVTSSDFAKARASLSAVLNRDLSGVRLVCGAGHLQWRKGTDIFAMTAQIARHRDPETVFLWIGDGLTTDDPGFGVWMDYHLRQIGAGTADSNLLFLPAGPEYPNVLAASDAMFVSSRLDPLPNVVFDALKQGCRIVQFEGASGFGDAVYAASGMITSVEYGNPDAAARALLSLPRKTTVPTASTDASQPFPIFAKLREALHARLASQRYFVRGASQIDVPVLFTPDEKDAANRVKEREKMLRYRRRLVWRDLDEVEGELAASSNWGHKTMRLAPYGTAPKAEVPEFCLHVHAYYTDELADDIRRFSAYQNAKRVVVTTDTAAKGDKITAIMKAQGLTPEIVLVPNKGRDILPFMDLFRDGGVAGEDEIWCHLHQKKSVSTTSSGDVWRKFLMRILLGNDTELSDALTRIAEDGVGFVAPFDPYCIPWNDSRRLLDRFAPRLPGPMAKNPLLFPVGNMFLVRREVVLAMNDVFGEDYPWPNEPIANDGTEFHLIERLWPAMTAARGLESVFVHKLDEKRV